MLTRLKVNGFKNLVDVDVRFGPFTCIAGVNGSGKSNLFDAIRFLSLLAEKPLVEAALSIVRGSGGRSADIRSLFHKVGDQYAEEMSFEAEMIIPAEGIDDLGQPIKAAATYLRYSLVFSYLGTRGFWPSEPLQILHEELVSISTEIPQYELTSFHHAGVNRQFFSIRQGQPMIVHLDPPPHSYPAERMSLNTAIFPRTILASRSIGPISSDPTVILTCHEMASWRVLQLDPAAMRTPDDLTAPTTVGSDGAHIAATLYSVAHAPPSNGRDPYEAETAVYARVASRLYDLLGEVLDVDVERDDKREELELYVKGRDGTRHSARALSDGTLRFLALAVLEAQEQPEVMCVEEPENGIHPGRIPALLDLLQAIAMDTRYPIEEGNPLRQVIISTHSPSVVMRVPDDSLVVAELWPSHDDRGRFKRARFRGLANTWRDPVPGRDSLALGTLLTYLNPEGYRPLPEPDPERDPGSETRVMDRSDVRRMLSPLPPD